MSTTKAPKKTPPIWVLFSAALLPSLLLTVAFQRSEPYLWLALGTVVVVASFAALAVQTSTLTLLGAVAIVLGVLLGCFPLLEMAAMFLAWSISGFAP